MTKLKPFHLILWGLLLAVPGGVYAQESSYPPVEGIEKDKGAYYTGEEDTRKADNDEVETDTLYRSSSSTTYEQSRISEKESGKQDDEDVLSFNFLYYIIQKYKMSDIVDK